MVLMVYDCEGLGLKHLWKPAVEAYGEVRGCPHPGGLWLSLVVRGAGGPLLCPRCKARAGGAAPWGVWGWRTWACSSPHPAAPVHVRGELPRVPQAPVHREG